MEVWFDYVKINEATIGLDSRQGVANFISHAHSDHAFAFSKKIPALSSEQTIAIRNFNGQCLSPDEIGKILGGAKVKLLNAGHIFGAKQLYIENSGSVLFTGDIKLRANLVVKGAETIQAENLILDCTYGKKDYVFPEPFEIYDQMRKYIKSEKPDTTVLMGYSTGKAQELIKFVNEYLGYTPVVDKSIAKISRLHKANGCNLDFIELGTREADEIIKGDYIAVVSPDWSLKNSFKKAASLLNRKAKIIYATGWALDRDFSFMCDKAFPLSDHCDFNELMHFVEQVNPKRVFCRYGFVEDFARELQKKGIQAIAASH